jgi:hypothetical protein
LDKNTEDAGEGFDDFVFHVNKKNIVMDTTAMAFVHHSVFRSIFGSAEHLKE